MIGNVVGVGIVDFHGRHLGLLLLLSFVWFLRKPLKFTKTKRRFVSLFLSWPKHIVPELHVVSLFFVFSFFNLGAHWASYLPKRALPIFKIKISRLIYFISNISQNKNQTKAKFELNNSWKKEIWTLYISVENAQGSAYQEMLIKEQDSWYELLYSFIIF